MSAVYPVSLPARDESPPPRSSLKPIFSREPKKLSWPGEGAVRRSRRGTGHELWLLRHRLGDVRFQRERREVELRRDEVRPAQRIELVPLPGVPPRRDCPLAFVVALLGALGGQPQVTSALCRAPQQGDGEEHMCSSNVSAPDRCSSRFSQWQP